MLVLSGTHFVIEYTPAEHSLANGSKSVNETEKKECVFKAKLQSITAAD